MRKLLLLLLLLALGFSTSSARAYQSLSLQRQAADSEFEVSIESNSTATTNQKVDQEQHQRILIKNDDQLNKEIRIQQRTGVTEKPKKLRVETVNKTIISDDEAIASPKPLANCEAVKARLSDHLASFTKSAAVRVAHYDKVVKTTTELLTRLQTEGIDVTQLQSAMTVVTAKFDQLKTTQTAYQTEVQQLHDLSCDATQTDRKTAFSEMRTARQNFEQAAAAMRAVIADQLKPALQAIRSSVNESQS